jgi:AAA+ ATPase superfamily predicted ATPase
VNKLFQKPSGISKKTSHSAGNNHQNLAESILFFTFAAKLKFKAMAIIIGRETEQNLLGQYVESEKPEFVAVFGRRRVGKTFLIREYFNHQFDFYFSGVENTEKQQQLENFNTVLQKHGKEYYPVATSWFKAFEQLIHLLEKSKKKGRKVIFIDELPWLDTPRSSFIQALEYFLNTCASANPDIMLIVCGSATSWMINKLIKKRGGLHNRVTRQIPIEPFTLQECEEFLNHNQIVLSRHQIIECYMIMGGIPYYLEQLGKSLGLPQNIDNLFFKENGVLRLEFTKLYASLFKHSDRYIKIIEALGKKRKGLTREEIIATTKLSDGGSLSKMLEELELCGFIRSYNAFEKRTKERLYQLIDFYSLFYLNFIKNSSKSDEHFWTSLIDNAKHRAWSGYAFEQICMQHAAQIRRKLGISGVVTYSASWRSRASDPAVQVDLLIDRNDGIINLCEIKYAESEFVIDKKQDEILRNKRSSFINETKTRKAVHITMITTYGVKHNEYWGRIQSEVTMNDLFINK